MLEYETLAKEGRLGDAMVSYVRAMDWVSFPELQRALAPYMPTTGDSAIEFPKNLVVWLGMSREFVDILLDLTHRKVLHYHSACVLTHLVDGGVLRLPVAKDPKRAEAGYKKPHWLPVCLRVVPLEADSGHRRRSKRREAHG